MKYIFRCDCILILAHLVEHVRDSLMYVLLECFYVIMQIGESSLAKHILGQYIYLFIFLGQGSFPISHRMHCIPCCGPELGVSLDVEGVLSLVGVFCFPVV